MFACLVIFILVFSLFSYGALAAEGDGVAEFSDAGMTPNNIFYGFELWRESREINSAETTSEKIALEMQHLAERYSEMHQLINEGDEKAKIAAKEAERIYSNIGGHIEQIVDESSISIEQIQSGDSSLHDLLEIENQLLNIENTLHAEVVELTESQIEAGAIEEEAGSEIVTATELGGAVAGNSFFEEKEGIIDHLSESIPEIEAEIVVAEAEKDSGIEGGYKETANTERIEELKDKIEELNGRAEALKEGGDTEGSAALETLVANAEVHLQKSEYALENEIYGRAYGQLNSAERLILNAERKISEGEIDIGFVKEVIGEPVDVINGEIDDQIEDSEEIIRTYEDEAYKKRIIEEYPERERYYKEEYERAKKSQELTDKLRAGGVMDKWFEELRAEGLSEQEVMANIGKRWDAEFKNVYGEEYMPPGFIKPIEREETIEERGEKAKKSEELTNKLRGEGIMDKWMDELRAEGLSEQEINSELGKRWDAEFKNVYGEEWIPPGGQDIKWEEEDETYKLMPVWPPLEVIPIGRIDVIEDPETGEKKIKGWYDNGKLHDKIEWGGGFVRGIEYKDPMTGNNYIFDGGIYRYTTPAGVVYEETYPVLGEEGKVFDPTNDFERGDEVYTYYNRDSEGNVVEYSYSATGYEADVKTEEEVAEIVAEQIAEEAAEAGGEVGEETATGGEATGEGETTSEEIKVDAELAYPTGTYVVEGGGRIEESPNNFVYVDESGILSEWDYDPNYETYINPETGKVFDPDVSYHDEAINYDVIDGKYKYSGPEGVWTYKDEGTWESPTGEVKKAYVPAPIGHEDKKEYTMPSGEKWKYDTESATWEKFDSAGAKVESYSPPPNHYSYYDGREGKYVDYKGNTYSSDQWQNEGARGQPYVSSGKTWNYNSATGNWESSQGEQYNPTTATYAGGSGEGSRQGYGRVYDSSGKEVKSHNYNYGYNVYNPDGSVSYYSSTQTPSSDANAPQSYTDYSGRAWARSGDGTWSLSGGGAAVGTTTTYNGKTYTVTQDKGWTDESGNAVPPPPGQPSSSVGGSYGGYNSYTGGPGYNAAPSEGAYSPSGSGGSLGHIYRDGQWRQVDPNNPTDAASAEAARQSGNVWGSSAYGYGSASGGGAAGTYGGYYGSGYSGGSYGSASSGGSNYGSVYDSSTGQYRQATAEEAAVGGSNYVAPGGGYYGGYSSPEGGYSGGSYSSGGYVGGSGSYYPGSSSSGGGAYGGGYDSSGSYVGGSYGGYDSSGSYVGTGGGSYSGGDYSGSYSGSGTYSGGDSGSYSGGDSGGSYSGGDSGGSTGGDSGGSTGGGDGGGGTGMAIGEFEVSEYGLGDAIGYIFKSIF